MTECTHEQFQLAKKYFKSTNPKVAQRFHLCRQCLTCGSQVGENLPNGLADGLDVPAFDEELRSSWYEKQRIEREREQQEKEQKWRDAYEQYLASPEWDHKRTQVLSRDQHKCQARMFGCQTWARDVHHLTYLHLGDEPLWDLVSVCRNCHNSIHGKLNEQAA